MRDYVHEHFFRYPNQEVRPAIQCADGFQYSVQASDLHYCYPRQTGALEYYSVEVWGRTPSGRHTRTNPEGWVSVERVNRRIHRHGGPVY